jgi:ParB family chromosome partitioning protein
VANAKEAPMSTKEQKTPVRKNRTLPVDRIVPDDANRPIDEGDEAFVALVDSIRVLGVLQPIHVQDLGDETYRIIDGERRWRASQRAGLTEVACDVWPMSVDARDTLVAGVVLNEQRQAHRCIHVARRLREIKIAGGLTGEQVAAQTGLSVDRVKTYLCLFGGSEFLIEFFEQHDVPVRVAAEFIRYEKATNEARARRLVAQYLETPLSQTDIIRLRKREGASKDATMEEPRSAPRRPDVVRALARAWHEDPGRIQKELEVALAVLGYRLVPVEGVA